MNHDEMRAYAQNDGALEVLVADCDALFEDACEALNSASPSPLLAAIDAGTARAFMSEQAFKELGWMSAKVAHNHDLPHADLREAITREYLPRVPVIRVPTADEGYWMPSASGVSDPNDLEHVQVARRISARTVYSHDRHLRGPGFAPATRADYDARIAKLNVITRHKQAEVGAVAAAVFAGKGTFEGVAWLSGRLKLRPSTIWAVLAATTAAAAYLLVAPPQRRARIVDGFAPFVGRLSSAIEQNLLAQGALSSTDLPASAEPARIETVVAAYLARHPGSTILQIAEGLGLTSDQERALPVVLQHPSFGRLSRRGWGVGNTRVQLETWPKHSGSA